MRHCSQPATCFVGRSRVRWQPLGRQAVPVRASHEGGERGREREKGGEKGREGERGGERGREGERKKERARW